MLSTRYRKKPVVIEAIRLQEENGEVLAEWCGGTWHPTAKAGYSSSLRINTLEGVMTARLGDYIIKGIRGEFYPCKSDIFDATYELALDGDPAAEIQRHRDAANKFVQRLEELAKTKGMYPEVIAAVDRAVEAIRKERQVSDEELRRSCS
jgi:hypothetical protein